MVTKDEAIRPVFNLQDYIKPKKEDIEVADLTEDEKTLAGGAKQAFWKVLKGHIENEIQILDQINEQAIAQGLSVEEIGKNTIIISQVKGVLRRIFNVVGNAREAADNGKAR